MPKNLMDYEEATTPVSEEPEEFLGYEAEPKTSTSFSFGHDKPPLNSQPTPSSLKGGRSMRNSKRQKPSISEIEPDANFKPVGEF